MPKKPTSKELEKRIKSADWYRSRARGLWDKGQKVRARSYWGRSGGITRYVNKVSPLSFRKFKLKRDVNKQSRILGKLSMTKKQRETLSWRKINKLKWTRDYKKLLTDKQREDYQRKLRLIKTPRDEKDRLRFLLRNEPLTKRERTKAGKKYSTLRKKRRKHDSILRPQRRKMAGLKTQLKDTEEKTRLMKVPKAKRKEYAKLLPKPEKYKRTYRLRDGTRGAVVYTIHEKKDLHRLNKMYHKGVVALPKDLSKAPRDAEGNIIVDLKETKLKDLKQVKTKGRRRAGYG